MTDSRNHAQAGDKPGPVHQVTDAGALSSTAPASTTDPNQPSALGGDVATRSNQPDEDREG